MGSILDKIDDDYESLKESLEVKALKMEAAGKVEEAKLIREQIKKSDVKAGSINDFSYRNVKLY